MVKFGVETVGRIRYRLLLTCGRALSEYLSVFSTAMRLPISAAAISTTPAFYSLPPWGGKRIVIDFQVIVKYDLFR